MEALMKAVQAHDLDQLAIIAGEPQIFLGLALALGLSLLAGFFLPGPGWLKLPFWMLFLACDVAVFYLAFTAAPELTDFDYGPVAETPPAAVAMTARPASSEQVCWPIGEIDPGRVTPEIARSCDGGDAVRQSFLVWGLSGGRLCYNVTAEPEAGHQCAVSLRFRVIGRHPRDGLLQAIHARLGRTAREAGELLPYLP